MSKSFFIYSTSAVGVVSAIFIAASVGQGDSLTPAERQRLDIEHSQNETIDILASQGITVAPIQVPAEFYNLQRGSYEVKIPTESGERDCIANVVITTHGRKNVILACN